MILLTYWISTVSAIIKQQYKNNKSMQHFSMTKANKLSEQNKNQTYNIQDYNNTALQYEQMSNTGINNISYNKWV